jgi:hypothetical protein
MGSLMLIIALLTATHPPNPNGPVTSTGIAAIAMVYIEAGPCLFPTSLLTFANSFYSDLQHVMGSSILGKLPM